MSELKHLTSVVLPHPLGPVITMNSPRSIEKSIFFIAGLFDPA